MKKYKTVLSIAGSDSGGGAGIQADTKTIMACGCYAATAITSITVQNTLGVRAVHRLPAELVAAQTEAVLEDIGADAVKIGMLPDEEIVRSVARILRKYKIKNIVLDPVMIATSGDRLISEAAVEAIRTELFPLARVITPNIPEAEYISGMKISSEEDFAPVAAAIRSMGVQAVLMKAGHLEQAVLDDYLFEGNTGNDSGNTDYLARKYSYQRIDTPNTHGTGCTLSSAVASYLALGYPLHEAVTHGEAYIHEAIRQGAQYKLGAGHGPVYHFYRPQVGEYKK